MASRLYAEAATFSKTLCCTCWINLNAASWPTRETSFGIGNLLNESATYGCLCLLLFQMACIQRLAEVVIVETMTLGTDAAVALSENFLFYFILGLCKYMFLVILYSIYYILFID